VPDDPTVYTVGHGTLSETELVNLLREAEVAHVVDVRSYPASRRNPQHGQERLAQGLAAGGIRYSWDRRLGGRRRPDPASRNIALRDDAFRAYADHMSTPEFAAGLDALVEVAAAEPVAVMCAESVWWRCHRRLLADALVLLRSVTVAHLFHDGRLAAHPPTPEARVATHELVYDLGSTAPLL
jgi:uncharacterized protein (DUF488 family)